LGSNGDVEEILSHPWLKDYDLPSLLEKKIIPDYIPII